MYNCNKLYWMHKLMIKKIQKNAELLIIVFEKLI